MSFVWCNRIPERRHTWSIREHVQRLPCKYKLRWALTAHDVRRLCRVPVLCLCCLSISAGCNGLRDGCLSAGERGAMNQCAHYTTEQLRVIFTLWFNVYLAARRGGRVGKTVWQLDSECLLRDTHLKTDSRSLRHKWMAGNLWEAPDCMKTSTYSRAHSTRRLGRIRFGPPGPPSSYEPAMFCH